MKTTLEISKAICEIIKEHNLIWEDVKMSPTKGHPGYPRGFRCFDLKPNEIAILADGLARKGYKRTNG